MPFVINKTQTDLVLHGGYMEIKRSKFKEVTAEELNHPGFESLLKLDMIEVSDTLPGVLPEPEVPEVVTEVSIPSGLTEAEYLTSLNEAPETSAPETTGHAIGRPESVEPVDPTKDDEAPTETKTKKSKKAEPAPTPDLGNWS